MCRGGSIAAWDAISSPTWGSLRGCRTGRPPASAWWVGNCLGNLLYNRDASFNPLLWNTAFWVSPAEAAKIGGVFVPAESPEWREGRWGEWAMKLLGMLLER